MRQDEQLLCEGCEKPTCELIEYERFAIQYERVEAAVRNHRIAAYCPACIDALHQRQASQALGTNKLIFLKKPIGSVALASVTEQMQDKESN